MRNTKPRYSAAKAAAVGRNQMPAQQPVPLPWSKKRTDPRLFRVRPYVMGARLAAGFLLPEIRYRPALQALACRRLRAAITATVRQKQWPPLLRAGL